MHFGKSAVISQGKKSFQTTELGVSRPFSPEACEDARFIMGMLEGRWLANSDDAG